MQWLYTTCIIFIGVLGFAVTWRQLGDTQQALKQPDSFKNFFDMKIKRGFDGKPHLEQISTHRRFAYSLVNGLLMALMLGYFYKWFFPQ